MSDTITLPEVAEPERVEDIKRQPPYNVVLLDDDDHTVIYVIRMLKELFGYPEEKGFQMAVEVDTTGCPKTSGDQPCRVWAGHWEWTARCSRCVLRASKSPRTSACRCSQFRSA